MPSPASSKTLTADFTSGNVPRQLVGFAAPLFLSSLLQMFYHMADMVIVGQKLGKTGLSAVSIGGDVAGLLTFLAMGFAGAGQVIIAQYMGAGQKDQVGRFIGAMFSCLMVCALALGGLCLFLREPMLRLMHTPEAAFAEALRYATVSICGLVFIYGYNIVSAALRGMGDAIRPFCCIAAASLLNIALDLLFVLRLDLGSAGAALATVISQALSFLGCAWYIIKQRRRYGLVLRARDFLRPDPAMLGRLIRLGLPMALKSASVISSKLFVNSWINSYGVAVSAFAGVANKMGSAANLMSNAFGTAGASMVGQNIGAERFDRVRETMFSVFRVTFALATLPALALVLFPERIYGCFTGDPEVLDIGLGYLPIAILVFYSSAARSGMNALINGSGNYRVNFLTAILDGIVLRIGLALLFGLALHMRHFGFWLGDALAGYTPFWIGIWFYLSGRWRKRAV